MNSLKTAFASIFSLLLVGLATFPASAETVNFGSLNALTAPGDLDLTGSIVYAIDVGGPGATVSGVPFDPDNTAYSGTGSAPGGNNDLGAGTYPSPATAGYYPALNSPGNWATVFSGDGNLNALMSYGRNDSGNYRVAQFDVTPGNSYRVQILAKSAGTEDRTWDLSVGFGTAGDLANTGTLDAWLAGNFAVDNWQESSPKVWSHTLVASSSALWINAATANYLGDPAPADPNPIVNAIIVTDLGAVPEPSTFVLAALGLVGLIGWSIRR